MIDVWRQIYDAGRCPFPADDDTMKGVLIPVDRTVSLVGHAVNVELRVSPAATTELMDAPDESA